MDLFTKLFGDFLLFVYHCFDRIVIRGYPRPAPSPTPPKGGVGRARRYRRASHPRGSGRRARSPFWRLGSDCLGRAWLSLPSPHQGQDQQRQPSCCCKREIGIRQRAEVGLQHWLDQPEPYGEDEEGPNLAFEFPRQLHGRRHGRRRRPRRRRRPYVGHAAIRHAGRMPAPDCHHDAEAHSGRAPPAGSPTTFVTRGLTFNNRAM
jgi:hypothetical protein